MIGETATSAQKLGYWVSTALTAALFAVPGAALLAHVPHFVQDMAHLGYPEYFLRILGVWKVLGAVIILSPRLPQLKEWAYAGMIFDATSAAISRASVGDDAFKVVAPLAIAVVVMLSWGLRPKGRTLKAR
jgi:uncharacterized membrane protein YphA (DoxX/SURF4 family)